MNLVLADELADELASRPPMNLSDHVRLVAELRRKGYRWLQDVTTGCWFLWDADGVKVTHDADSKIGRQLTELLGER